MINRTKCYSTACIEYYRPIEMTVPRLIFFPADARMIIDQHALIEQLKHIAFIEDTQTRDTFPPGERFLSLLSFLGCSPNIKLSAQEGDDYCFISLLKASDESRCLGHTPTVKPKCPHCRKRIAGWQVENWQRGDTPVCCDKCGKASDTAELNWKHECGFGRCGFTISHIYPHEAVPTEQLLSLLQQFSGTPWDYCYAR